VEERDDKWRKGMMSGGKGRYVVEMDDHKRGKDKMFDHKGEGTISVGDGQ